MLNLPGHPYNPFLWPLTAESVNVLHNPVAIDQPQAVNHGFMTLVGVMLIGAVAMDARGWTGYLCRLFCNQDT